MPRTSKNGTIFRSSISIDFNGIQTSFYTDACVYILKAGCLQSGDELPDGEQDCIA